MERLLTDDECWTLRTIRDEEDRRESAGGLPDQGLALEIVAAEQDSHGVRDRVLALEAKNMLLFTCPKEGPLMGRVTPLGRTTVERECGGRRIEYFPFTG